MAYRPRPPPPPAPSSSARSSAPGSPPAGASEREGRLSSAPPAELAVWDGPTGTGEETAAHRTLTARGERPLWLQRFVMPVVTPVIAQLSRVTARFLDVGARSHAAAPAESGLTRTGGPLARWVSFPHGVRWSTALVAGGAAGLGFWGVLALAAYPLASGALVGAALLTSLSVGPLGVRMALRLHRLFARHRRMRIVELRGVPDRRAVAVRGVVIARQTTASSLDGRPLVWSLTRFRRARLRPDFFHEQACDFLIDDGTDEPVWVEVRGGMLVDEFPPSRRVAFDPDTMLEVSHPVMARFRIDGRKVHAAEIAVAPGDVVEVVGRLSRRLDPTAHSASEREPPQRRVLCSGTRVPVMVRRVGEPDLSLAHVRRALPRGAADASPGEPPRRKF